MPKIKTKIKSQFVCQSCGVAFPKWAGQCGECGEWNTLVEGQAVAPARSASRSSAGRIRRLTEVEGDDAPRVPTGVAEFDRVLGGGLVPGSVILIGGDPGIGKSTLLMQVLGTVDGKIETLYVTGEESLGQVRMRARRLGFNNLDLPVLSETAVEQVLAQLHGSTGLVVIDSIQTLFSENLESAPGSVSQLRECAAQLVRHAKARSCAVILVGHVTKEGAIAGPRVLEHMVDTVLYFEHDSGSRFRIVRAVKNRFGAVNELGVFAMTDGGLKEVSNPSALFLSRHEQPVPGSAITVVRQGTRPIVVEVQALVDPTRLDHPRRVTLGLDSARLHVLAAVLHRHAGISLGDQDVFASVVGGMRIQEPAADLPLVMATVSSHRNRPLPADTIFFGEVGLAGEIRPVAGGEERLVEAAKHGFRHAVIPEANRPRKSSNIECVPIKRLQQALDLL